MIFATDIKKIATLALTGIVALGCSPEPGAEAPALLTISETSLSDIESIGIETSIEVESNYDFDIGPLSEQESEWLYFEKGSSEEGKTLVAVTVHANYTASVRTAAVSFRSKGARQVLNISQKMPSVEVSGAPLEFANFGGAKYLTVTASLPDWRVEVAPGSEWCTVARLEEGRIEVKASANTTQQSRTASVLVSVGEFTSEIAVTQARAIQAYADKQLVQLQQAAVGTGVNIVIMGDGYTAADMNGGGKYESDMVATMEHFFSTYPYDAFRHYFNVWMVAAVSNQAGISTISPRSNVDTVFGSLWDGPSSGSTGIGFRDMNGDGRESGDGDDVVVLTYAELAASKAGKPMSEMTVIIPINANVYAGTCWMYEDNFSISFCPAGSYFREVVVHETGGHGFGKLMDEYVYYSGTIPGSYKSGIQQGKRDYGWYANVDFYSDIAKTTWAAFAGNPDYKMVGTYEGSYMFSKGIWRPEYNSCMNNNVFYFNAPSRYAQMERIHKWAGMEYSFEQFLRDDIIPPYPQTRAGEEGVLKPFVPFAPPVVIKKTSSDVF